MVLSAPLSAAAGLSDEHGEIEHGEIMSVVLKNGDEQIQKCSVLPESSEITLSDVESDCSKASPSTTAIYR